MVVPFSVPPEAESHLVPGYRLDRYELLCPIGTGGMASVWIARLLGKHGFEKLVAIKTILPRYARDPRFQQMFLDEARIASRIDHPNVAQILDLGDHQGVLFLAMEWVDGEALYKLARAVHETGVTFPPGVALRIVAEVCAGLHAAHELRDRDGSPLGIVHRDVSPHNILIGDQGVAKIIDFGIAKARDRVAGDTETGSFKGKVKYMAPEQALSPRSTDRRADLWAVGAVLYFLISGRTPYGSDNDIATLARLASGKPPLPLPAQIPAAVRVVVQRALAWNANDRYSTADELRKATEDAMRELHVMTTSADVAAFFSNHLADRTDARKKAIARALRSAEERSHVLNLVTTLEESSGSFRFGRGGVSAAAPSSGKLPNEPSKSQVSQSSLTLGSAATMTTNPVTSVARKRLLLGGLTLIAVVPLIVMMTSVVFRAGRASNGAGSTAASVAVEPAPSWTSVLQPSASATPSGPTTPAATTTAPSEPAANAERRRTPVTRTTSPAARPNSANRDSATTGAPQHRSEYGF
ncbi:MAG TPA: serine/threonine-protein kinase [Polyangiaceae bacterium]|jgi:serine/threonine-protein kinase|nr:serine/threonine-protein kinase [Polyangiaceae bacterium]